MGESRSSFAFFQILNFLGFGSSEYGRGTLAFFVACLDISIVAQDWEFPRFKSTTEVKLPGFKAGTINFKCLKDPRFHIKVTGKWVNYGVF